VLLAECLANQHVMISNVVRMVVVVSVGCVSQLQHVKHPYATERNAWLSPSQIAVYHLWNVTILILALMILVSMGSARAYRMKAAVWKIVTVMTPSLAQSIFVTMVSVLMIL
jgi:hypothetical protein